VANDPKNDDPDAAHRHSLFAVLFELVSAFGNVGLSLGSYQNLSSPCSFSVDLDPICKGLVMLTMLVGRTRDFPKAVNSSLAVSYSTQADLLRDVEECDREAFAGTVNDDGTLRRRKRRSASPSHSPSRLTRHGLFERRRDAEFSQSIGGTVGGSDWRASMHENLVQTANSASYIDS
jgi:hypothetical protein